MYDVCTLATYTHIHIVSKKYYECVDDLLFKWLKIDLNGKEEEKRGEKKRKIQQLHNLVTLYNTESFIC